MHASASHMDATTRRLVDFASRADYSALTQDVVHECKRRIIDTLACMVAAYDKPLCEKARAVAQRYAGPGGNASVLGSTWKTMPESAAFANGIMMRYLDLMDSCLYQSRGHPCDVFGGVLAVAEATHANGPAFINALTLAYDTYGTFCQSVDINTKGWDQPVCGAIAGVTGISKLLNLNPEQMAHAVALTLTPNMALFRTRRGELSNWKGCAAANAARNAVFAAYLAADGFTGPTEVFEGKWGLWDVVGKFDWQFNVGGQSPHHVALSHLKSFPIVYHAQPTAWAGLEIRPRVRLSEVKDILIETYHLAVEMNGTDPSRFAPQTRETADHSLPYVLALALVDGEVTAKSFLDHRIKDPALLAVMSKMQVSEDTALTRLYPHSAPCRVTVTMNNGERIVSEVINPKGHISNPLEDKDIDNKFRNCFNDFGSGQQCERALQALWNLEQCQDMADIIGLFVRG